MKEVGQYGFKVQPTYARCESCGIATMCKHFGQFRWGVQYMCDSCFNKQSQAVEWFDHYEHVKAHAEQQQKRNFWKVHTPMPAYKRVWTRSHKCIANLLIPAGTLIHAGEYEYKMRADVVQVHSIWALWARVPEGEEKTLAVGHHKVEEAYTNPCGAPITNYFPGELVYPDKFTMLDEQCSHGIHFFADAHSAVWY